MKKFLLCSLSLFASASSFAADRAYACAKPYLAAASAVYEVKFTIENRDELAFGRARVGTVSIEGKNALANERGVMITGKIQNHRVRDALGRLPHDLEITPYLLNEGRAFEFAVDYGVIERISVIERAKTDAMPSLVVLHERTGEIHVTRCAKN